MSRVSIRDFSFRYRKEQRPILSDINLTFSTDERILILGPSGGGKSTLLLALLRLYTAFDIYYSEGCIEYDGVPGDELSRRRFLELFGIVFQSPSHQFCMQYPEEEAAFGLENMRIKPSAMPGFIDSSFQRFNFTKRDHPVQNLSGGEQQVLAAASTTLLNSKMLVMDEPTAHLDPPGRRSFRSSLESWLSSETGFLLVEHHIDLWLDLIQRVIVLDETGRILFDEPGLGVLTREKELLSRMGVWLPRQSGRAVWAGARDRARASSDRVDLTSAPSALEFCGADLGYGGKSILPELNLDIRKGELVALVGKNGCGKTTLLQSLVGLSDIYKGSIHLNGKSYRSLKEKLKLQDAPAYLFRTPSISFSIRRSGTRFVRHLDLRAPKRKNRLCLRSSGCMIRRIKTPSPFREERSGGFPLSLYWEETIRFICWMNLLSARML